MSPDDHHSLLIQQIQEIFGSQADVPKPVEDLLKLVSQSYAQFDESYKKLQEKAELRTQQLIASTSHAYSFLDSLHMGFIMCDLDAEVVLSNASVRAILSKKATPDSWTLDSVNQLMQPDLAFKDLVVECLKSSQPIERDEVNFGKQVLRLSVAPVLTEGMSGEKQLLAAIVLIEDITEQKVLERSKDEFLSIASHELRTPLTAIRGNASLLKKYYTDQLTDPAMVEMVDDIHESSTRLINIVNDFLDVAAMEQGRIKMDPAPFRLYDPASEVVHELQALCDSKGITLALEPSLESIPEVVADRQRIKQVIYNLVGNAIKFTEAGSITLSARNDNSFVYCSVRDTGRGMPIESQKLLFRKFQQAGTSLLTRDTTKGTGLGLYISKLIIELSDGAIGLDSSEPGKGSTFLFSVPVAGAEPPEHAAIDHE